MSRSKTRQQHKDGILEVIRDPNTFIDCYSAIFVYYVDIGPRQGERLKLNSDEDILEAIRQKRRSMRSGLLQRMMLSENPTSQVAALKIVGSDEDRAALSQQNISLNAKVAETRMPKEEAEVFLADLAGKISVK